VIESLVRVIMGMAVVMRMMVIMGMGMTVRVRFLVIVSVHLAIFMGVPLIRIRLAVRTRVFVEDQGLDGHRHGP
jgi:hypothetical protein